MNVEQLIEFAQKTIEQYHGISLNDKKVKILKGALNGEKYFNIASTIYDDEMLVTLEDLKNYLNKIKTHQNLLIMMYLKITR